MDRTYDVIVVGVGSMGAAACYHLARRGVRVLGLERFGIPHAQGSHHGQSRIIRKAYFEHPDYIPLLNRAYENWHQLEQESGQRVFHRVGGIYFGRPGSSIIADSLRAMRQYGLSYQELTHAQASEQYPMFQLPEDFVGLAEPDAGFLVPETAVAVMAQQALGHGAVLHGHEQVLHWQQTPHGVEVCTDRNQYQARRIVFTSGAWTHPLVGDLGVKLKVTRQVLAWVWPQQPERFALGRLPIWALETGDGGLHYGFPMTSDRPGFKIALHLPAEQVEPDAVVRQPLPHDEATFRPVLERYIPHANGPLLSQVTCLYTNTPDGHFIIDRHPVHAHAIVACGFSGHGFKFASVVGEALADLAQHDKTALPIDFLSLSRFG